MHEHARKRLKPPRAQRLVLELVHHNAKEAVRDREHHDSTRDGARVSKAALRSARRCNIVLVVVTNSKMSKRRTCLNECQKRPFTAAYLPDETRSSKILTK